MIRVEKIEVFNWEGAIRGARNPMNSWAKSDSGYVDGKYVVGENDLALMKRLVAAGSDERKFMRQILVSLDITAPRFWFAEFDTYKIATVSNSTSTMHTIHRKPFCREDFSLDYINKVIQNRTPIVVDREIWRETKYEGVFVSNSGKVRQSARDVTRSDGVVLHLPERELAVTEDDYLRVKIHTGDETHNCKLHRLMAEAFIDNPNDYPVINHIDGNKLNCNLSNLEWCSNSHNRQHACDNGLVNWSKESRKKCGIRSRKLNDEQVKKAKALREQGYTISDIAKETNSSNASISRILSGKLYVETKDTLDLIIDNLNELRELYLETNDKGYWRQIIELLPQSYNQTRTITLNYEVLRNMYHARKHHKLLEWRELCEAIEKLPYSELITMEGK